MIFLPSAKFIYRPQTTIPTPVANVYWEANYGVVTTTDGTTADASPVSGNKVLSWTSKGGTNKVLTNPTNANRPTYYVPAYGVPFITFDSTVTFQWLAGNNIANAFDNNQSMSMGVALRRPGAYNSSRNEPYILFNPGWNGVNKIEQNAGVIRYASGGDSIGDVPGTWITTSATREVTAESTIFGTFSTTATAQTAANAAASTGKIYLNGTLNNTTTGSATKTGVGYNGNYAFAVGGPAGGGVAGPSARDYYGVYLYTAELTEVQVSAAHADIASRHFGWSTLPVTGAALWLDASRSDTLFVESTLATAVTTDNGPVGGWKDLSGNNRHALQSPTTARPTWRTPINGQNGLGVMSFNGSTQYFDVANLPSLASGYTFYGIIKQPTATGAVISSASVGVDGSTAAMIARPAVTAVGNAQVSTTNSKFGAGSALFDGSGDYLSVSASEGFNFGTGAFTIEMFFRIPAGASAAPNGKVLVSNENASWSAGAFTLYSLLSTTAFRPSLYVNDFSTSTPILTPTSGDYRDDTWHHIAIVRQTGGAMSMYIDGTSVASATYTGNCGSSTRNLLIGHNLVSGREYTGGVADYRISKFARYTSAFTPSAVPLPDTAATDSNFAQTSLLLHMDGANGSTVFTDSSNNTGTGITQGGKSLAQSVISGTVVGVIGNYDGTHTAGNYLVRTSSSAANVSGVMTQTASTPATGTASIGRLTNATAYFNSQIYELVVLPRQSTTTEDTAWKTYTAAKWGITWS